MTNLTPKMVSAGMPNKTDLYRSFARLAADWVWEIDANLCYVVHDGRRLSVTGIPGEELEGRNRIEVLNECFPASDELAEHHQLLLQHKSIDLIIPVTRDSGVGYVNVIAEPQFDTTGHFSGFRGCGRDVTNRVELESELAHLATHDDLTGVINRREFERKLGVLSKQARSDNEQYSLCFIDLDRFKHVNDTGGHHAGDQLLRELVSVIQKHVHPGESVARLGGDEFGLLLKSDTLAAAKIAEKIIDEISRYEFEWESQFFSVGASIGIAGITQHNVSVESLMVRADNACYAAKHNGRNQSFVSEEADVEIESEDRYGLIKEAIENNQYKLLMQPIVSNTEEESFQRYELLVRLRCRNGDLLEPADFMPLAKRYSLLQELDYWVVENALHALELSHAEGKDVALSVNLSASTFANAHALNRIVSIFSSYEVPVNRVCFDITETHAIRNMESVCSFMDTLKAHGVEFALDDFGNGLTSFTFLRQLPINYLKIDGALIRELSSDTTVRCIVDSFHELGHKLGIKTIAESVEDTATIDCVKEIGIDYMQGFGVANLIELETLSIAGKAYNYE